MGPGVYACPRRRRQVADVSLPCTENASRGTRKSTVCDDNAGAAHQIINKAGVPQGRGTGPEHRPRNSNNNKFLARRKIYSKSVYSHFGHVSSTLSSFIEGHLPLLDCPRWILHEAHRQRKTDVPDNNVVSSWVEVLLLLLLDVTTPCNKMWGVGCERASFHGD